MGGLAVHAVRVELEHERRDRAGAPRLRLPGPDERRRTRDLRRALGVDEVRGAAPVAALVGLPGGAAPAQGLTRRRRVPDRDGVRLLRPLSRAVARARGARLLRSHRQLPGRSRITVFDLGLGPVPREGVAGPAPRPAAARARARDRCRRARLLPSPPLAAAYARAHRCSADRLRARLDTLVLSLPAVVLPVRRACVDRAAAGAPGR